MNRNSFAVLGAFLLVMMYNSSVPLGRSGQSSSSGHGESRIPRDVERELLARHLPSLI